jgi:hypothetical protein
MFIIKRGQLNTAMQDDPGEVGGRPLLFMAVGSVVVLVIVMGFVVWIASR